MKQLNRIDVIKSRISKSIQKIDWHEKMVEFHENRIKKLSDQLVKLENKEPAGFARDIEEIKEENIPF